MVKLAILLLMFVGLWRAPFALAGHIARRVVDRLARRRPQGP